MNSSAKRSPPTVGAFLFRGHHSPERYLAPSRESGLRSKREGQGQQPILWDAESLLFGVSNEQLATTSLGSW